MTTAEIAALRGLVEKWRPKAQWRGTGYGETYYDGAWEDCADDLEALIKEMEK